MIIQVKNFVSLDQATKLASENQSFCIQMDDKILLITGSGIKNVPNELEDVTDKFWVFPNDMQLASKVFNSAKRKIALANVEIGGDTKNTLLIGGPCSVESESQIRSSAELLKSLGLTTLRGGCFKPRTSPYSFSRNGIRRAKTIGSDARGLWFKCYYRGARCNTHSRNY